MNNILLINRLNPEEDSMVKKKIFFLLGGMSISSSKSKLMNIFDESHIVELEDVVYKYNGVELNITVEEIPKTIKLLTDKGIPIYSIFQVYNP